MNLKIFKLLFVVILFLTPLRTYAEHPDSTLSKIKTNKKLVEKTSETFNVDSDILSAIIFVERKENYTWEDEALDEYLAQAGLNGSIGFCQIKLKTAYWIEVQLNDSTSKHFPGKEFLIR